MAILTVKQLEAIVSPGRYNDGNGLYLEVDKTGGKRWLYRYQLNGKRTAHGLGGYHPKTNSLAIARSKAIECKALVNKGIHPGEAASEQRDAQRARDEKKREVIMTFERCADEWYERNEAGWTNTKHRQQVKNTPFQSGRLITPFQNLQSRDYKIRINTLINGNPITEVDFNANHLRMFLAFNKTDVIGEQDAYEPIVYESGLSRDKVKAFINIGLNNESFEATRDVVARSKPYSSNAESKQIANALNKLYPKLNLYCRFALMAMQLEGLIMRKVLLRGTEAGILALPIHDAIAVEFDNQDWAKDVMEEVWQSVMSEFHKPSKTSVKISF